MSGEPPPREPPKHRWIRAPELYSPLGEYEGGRRVGWFELFFDAVLAAVLVALSRGLALNASVEGYLTFAGLFVPVWWSWRTMTFFANRVIVDDVWHRAAVLLQIVAAPFLVVTAPAAAAGEAAPFALAYAVMRLLLVGLYARAARHVDAAARPLMLVYVGGFGVGGALWLASATLEAPYAYALWGAGLGVDLWTAHNRYARARSQAAPLDRDHLYERYNFFTLLVFGAGLLVFVLGVLGEPFGVGEALVTAAGLLLAAGMWWAYFDELAGCEVLPGLRSLLAWVYGHLMVAFGLVGVLVGARQLVHVDLVEPTPAGAAWVLAVSAAIYLVAMAILEWATERNDDAVDPRRRIYTRLLSAGAALALASVEGGIPAWTFLAAMVGVALLQVVVDVSYGVKPSRRRR